MATHSVAEARNQLSELIDRALTGEPVLITRDGRPVVELKPVAEPPHRVTASDLEWLRARRLKLAPGAEDGVTVVSRMRDEDEH
jgi:prevent-host-death family protein